MDATANRALVFFATPRKLPRASTLPGRVVVLDIAFAGNAGGASFETTTLPFIKSLGSRLAAWVDHHDSDHHGRFRDDPRYVLSTKAVHGACPEMITPELVRRIGEVQAIVCHSDFDGLMSAAKWLRGGIAPYEEADDDARAVDTCTGHLSERGARIDRALRGRPRDQALLRHVVDHLVAGASPPEGWALIDAAGKEAQALEEEAERLASRYIELSDDVIFVDASDRPYDRTRLLLLGQKRRTISIVRDGETSTFAAGFDSGINFLERFGLSGGMPTRVALPSRRLKECLVQLKVPPAGLLRVDGL